MGGTAAAVAATRGKEEKGEAARRPATGLAYLPIIVECCWTAASRSRSRMVHSPIALHPGAQQAPARAAAEARARSGAAPRRGRPRTAGRAAGQAGRLPPGASLGGDRLALLSPGGGRRQCLAARLAAAFK